MFTLVLVVNTILTLVCLVMAWKTWQLRRILGRVANTLTSTEETTRAFLQEAPDAIYVDQMGVYQLQEQYRQLGPQLLRAQQVLALLSLSQTVWRGRLQWLERSQRKGRFQQSRYPRL